MNADFFNDIDDYITDSKSFAGGFEKFFVSANDLPDVLNLLKNNPEHDYNRLNSIICIDNPENFELIYDLHSTANNKQYRVAVCLENDSPKIFSVVDIFKSAYFDECEIFDMFGVSFVNNPDLKRLLMPKNWIGYPLRKDYQLSDERLDWNRE